MKKFFLMLLFLQIFLFTNYCFSATNQSQIKAVVIYTNDFTPTVFFDKVMKIKFIQKGSIGLINMKYNKGAVESTMGDILHQHGYSIAFFNVNKEEKVDFSLFMNQIDCLFINGYEFTNNKETFEKIVPQLEAKYEKVRIYILGHGINNQNTSIKELIPFVRYDKDLQSGILISPYTKRMGIMVQEDFSSDLLSYFNIEEKTKTSTLRVNSKIKENIFLKTIKINENLNELHILRGNILKKYTSFIIFLLIVFILSCGMKINRLSMIYFIWLLFASFLVFPLMSLFSFSFKLNFFISCFIVILLFYVLRNYFDYENRTKYILQSICFLLLFNLWGSQKIFQNSILGYDAIIGARYYGIGNEYAGVLLGCSILYLGIFQQQKEKSLLRSITTYFFMAFLFLSFVHGDIGANYGASITVLFVILFYIFLNHYHKKQHPINKFYILLFIGIVMAVLYITNFISEHSHLKLFLSQIWNGNFEEIKEILLRKWKVNIRLIYFSNWSKILFLGIIYVYVFYIRNKKIWLLIKEEKKHIYNSFVLCGIGMIFGFLVNDSGVVLAANIMIILIINLYIISYRLKKGE